MLIYTCVVRTFRLVMNTNGGPCDAAKCAVPCDYYYAGYLHVILLKKFDQIPVIELSVGSATFLPFLQLEPWDLIAMGTMKFIVSIGSAYHCCSSGPFHRIAIGLMGLI